MTDATSLEQILGVVSAASGGDASARVRIAGDAVPGQLSARLGAALNVLLDELASRENAAKQMAGRLRLLADAAREFAAASQDYPRLLELVARRLSELAGDLCSIRTLSGDGKSFELDGAVHHPVPELAEGARGLLGLPQRVGEGMMGRVAATGQSFHLPQVDPMAYAATTLPQFRPFVEALAVTSCIAVPLKSGGKVIGVATLLRSDAARPFTDDDLRLLEAIAEHASLAIANSRSQAAERAAQANYRLMFENSPEIMFVFDPKSLRVLEVNDAAIRQYGYPRQKFLEMSLEQLWPPEDIERNRQAVAQNLPATGILAVRHRKQNGALFDAEVRAHAIPFDGREGRLVLLTDVTERLHAETARRAAEARFARLSDSGIIGIVIGTLDGQIVEINEALANLIGYSRADILAGRVPWVELTPAEWRHVDDRARAELRQAGVAALREKEYIRKDGTRVPVLVGTAMLQEGGPLGVIQFVLDLRGSGRLEAAIAQLGEARASEATFRSFVEAAPDAVLIVNTRGKIVLVNSQVERLFGYSRDELLGEPIEVLVPVRFREQHQSHRSTYFSEPRARAMGANLELYGLRKNGSEFPVEISLAPIETPAGPLFASAVRDITQRKGFEDALARAKGLAESASRELEAFSYSVAHDLRAPLRGMNGFAQVLLDQYEDKIDAEGQDFLREIVLNARKMGALIDALLSLARLTRGNLRREPVDLSGIVREIGARLTAAEPARSMELEIEPALSANADPVLVRALLDNLLANAWKFSARAKAGRIEFGAVPRDGELTFHLRDNGAGFDMAFASKLFAPFQRLHTGDEFPGTGIGLATVQRIVHRHGGNVWAEAKVGQGATFFFTLPPESSGGSS